MNILEKIALAKIDEVNIIKSQFSTNEMLKRISKLPETVNFKGALLNKIQKRKNAIIAEVKKASPSKGLLRKDFDLIKIVNAFSRGGAAGLSIITDKRFFQGDSSYIQRAKDCCKLPILRKDFIIDSVQVYETRLLGADGILLILSILDHKTALELENIAISLGLTVFVEVHNEEQLNRALSMRAEIIGINNRDTRTFEADLTNSEILSKRVPADRMVLSESGIEGPQDVARLNKSEIYCFLIGESLMRADDIGSYTEKLVKIYR